MVIIIPIKPAISVLSQKIDILLSSKKIAI
jgi:hypothetical protein